MAYNVCTAAAATILSWSSLCLTEHHATARRSVTLGTLSHLQELPAPPRARPRKRGAAARKMPGWGQAGGTWTAMDTLDREADAAAAAASGTGGGPAAQQQPCRHYMPQEPTLR